MRRDRGLIPGLAALLTGIGAMVAPVTPACAQVLEKEPPAAIRDLTLVDSVGKKLPLNLVVTESDAQPLAIADVFNDGRPVVMALVYYECPLVCTVVMDRMAEAFDGLDYTIGEDFNVLVVSFDPTETPTQALAAKQTYLARYNKTADSTGENWSFCVADEQTIAALSGAVGFQTRKLPDGEYAHPVGIMILSPDATLSRYMLGFEYPPRDLKLALLDATDGKIAKGFGDAFLHYCYRYDPEAGSYSMEAMALMRLGGALTVVLLAVLIGAMILGDRARKRRAAGSPAMSKANADSDAPATRGVVTGSL